MNRLDFDGLDGSLVPPAYKQGTASVSNSDQYGNLPAYAHIQTTELAAHTDSFPFAERQNESVDKTNNTRDKEQSDDSLFSDDTEPLVIETADSDQNGGSSNEGLPLHRLAATSKVGRKARRKEGFDGELADEPLVPDLIDRAASEPAAVYRPTSQQNHASPSINKLLTISAVFVAGWLIGGAGLLAWLNLENEIPMLRSPDKSPAAAVSQQTQNAPAEPLKRANAAVPHSPFEHAEKGASLVSGQRRTIGTFQATDDSGVSEQPALQLEDNLETDRTQLDQDPDTRLSQPKSKQDVIAEGNERGASIPQLADRIAQKALPANPNAPATSWAIPVSFNSLDVPEAAVEKLKAGLLRCDKEILITGHTCSLGGADKNYYVGLARAKSVRKTLEALGIPSDRLKVDSAGANRPVATNATEEGRKANRRVVITCR
jgi:hypothetical protein